MQNALLLIATCVIATLGFGLMAFSQKQHWRLFRASTAMTAPPAWLRVAGWLLVGLAAIPAIARDGPAFGLLLWTIMLTVSGLLVITCLARLRRRVEKGS